MNIQFLSFSDCPLAAPARKNLKTALADRGITDYEEIDILDPKVPEDIRSWGSPTILVNGRDVSGATKGHSISCRIYAYPDGVPDVKCIIACLVDA